MIEVFGGPRALVCTDGVGNKSLILTPVSPEALHRLTGEKQSRIRQFADRNPLFNLPRKASMKEVSVLNGGFLFDLEMPLAWKGLTGQDVVQMDRIWVYELSEDDWPGASGCRSIIVFLLKTIFTKSL